MNGTFDARDLMSPETYARERKGWHAEVKLHREQRTVQIGPNAALMFEDALTVRFQLQETLRIEDFADDAAIRAEIDAYSALIPDGSNFKATLVLGFADANERRARTADLFGVEEHVWMQVDGFARTFAIAEHSADRVEANRPPVRAVRLVLREQVCALQRLGLRSRPWCQVTCIASAMRLLCDCYGHVTRQSRVRPRVDDACGTGGPCVHESLRRSAASCLATCAASPGQAMTCAS